MHSKAILLFSSLDILTKKRYDVLLKKFGNLDEAYKHLSPDILSELGLRAETIEKTEKRILEFHEEEYKKLLKKFDINLMTIEDEAYPSLLREIPDPPVFLFYRGDIALTKQSCIALVGTRNMSWYGKRVVALFVSPFVHAGCITVSGMAIGIDSEVAKETVRDHGKHIAIFGHGLGNIYPKQNAALAEKVLKEGGLLLSEFPPDMPPSTYTFPARNRIIAGLSGATVILEAPLGSGAIITAELALDYNRDVFAVPGPITDANFAGCHSLIASAQAKLATGPLTVLQALEIVAPPAGITSAYRPMNPEEAELLQALTTVPQTVDSLLLQTKLPAATLSATLTMLELHGAARNTGGGAWVRS